MIKRTMILLAVMMSLFSSMMARDASAVDSIGIGASVWCAWWDPYWVKGASGLGLGTKSFELEPTAVGGPVLSLGINENWTIFTAYNYGKFTGEVSDIVIILPVKVTRIGQRHDLDFIVSRKIHKFVKVFFGLKYWGYILNTDVDITIPILFFALPISVQSEVSHHNAGPGFGFSFSFPLYKTLYLLPNVSGLLQFGKTAQQQSISIVNSSDSVLMYYGCNATLSLAYYIPKIRTTLALGGRFQYEQIKDVSDKGHMADGQSDMFYGIYFTAVYTFDISGSSKDDAAKGR